MRKSYLIGLAMVLAVSSLFLQGVAAGPPLPGAIFTTLEDGTIVNANHYADKRDVYLDGGPGPNAPQHAAGLPDGNYYFQVTDPSGKFLLSQDPVYCREFRVEDDVIVELVSIGRTYKHKGKDAPCTKDGWQYGRHDTGWDVDHDALTIQLMPYKNTPNRGGVYKAWATPIEHFDGDPTKVDNGYKPGYFHGFIPADSKTDNFKVKKGKVKPTPELKLCKFEDLNGNGLWDADEPGIPGWTFTVTDPIPITNTLYTGNDGCIVVDVSLDGFYTIEEEMRTDWAVTATIVNGAPVTPTQSVMIEVDGKESLSYSVSFGNFECFEVNGHKYNDLNGNGLLDTNEPGIAGWGITLYQSLDGFTWTEFTTTTTDANGFYSFDVCEGGQFKVVEDDPEGWEPTGPTSFTFTAVSGTDQGPFDFLNFECFTVDGYKYEDMNGNGAWDAGDAGIEGWTITLYKMGAGGWEEVASTTTDSMGYYSFSICAGGEYKVVEEARDGWVATSDTEFTFTGVSGDSQTFDFFNYELGQICGTKWYDFDKDGVQDAGEDIIEGFKIELYKDGSLFATATTDSNGEYCFEDLGPGDYTVSEVMPNDPGEFWSWAQTYPDGDWVFAPLQSGSYIDADFGNVVEFMGGLTWGYWKTHTGLDSPPKDPAYDLLGDNPMEVDVEMPDGDYLVDNVYDAKFVFEGAGDYPASCSGDCRSLFRAQLLALHMNLLKFVDMGGAIYIYDGDPFSGQTVQQIYDAAIALLNDGLEHDFQPFQETLDHINNNGHADPGGHVLVMKDPPVPEY
ncbi:MAG: SdrD B-like domain-containing protein [Thermoplasmata archaeon]